MGTNKNKRSKYINTTSILLFLLLAFPLFVSQAISGVPTIISYQGRLSNSNGDLLPTSGSSATFYFKFSIYDSSSGGTRLWPPSAPNSVSATVRQGVFNIKIGDTANGYPHPLTYNFNTAQDIYLQVDVSSTDSSFQELAPRQRIAATAFARLANSVSGTTTPSTFGTTTPIANSFVSIEATSTDSILATFRAFAGQVANIFQIQDSSGTNLLTFTGGGSLGIGTTSPAKPFSVQGDGLFSGDLSLANLIATGTLAVSGSGTSTFAGGLQANHLNILNTATSSLNAGLRLSSLDVFSSSATSTFANGIQLSGGCFRDILGSCVSGGVTSVANSDGSLTISPTTGSVVSSLNMANANRWLALQTIFVGGLTSTTTILGNGGTSTFAGGLQANHLNILNTATSSLNPGLR